MKSRGIIFSSEMVRAILEGRKTCTRRLDKSWLKYKKGDEIWVRETWADGIEGCPNGLTYRADHIDPKGDGPANPIKWKSPYHMFRKDSRKFMILTEDARLERLQDITVKEIEAEGLEHPRTIHPCIFTDDDLILKFIDLWDSLHPKKNRWIDNPKVVRLCWG